MSPTPRPVGVSCHATFVSPEDRRFHTGISCPGISCPGVISGIPGGISYPVNIKCNALEETCPKGHGNDALGKPFGLTIGTIRPQCGGGH